MALNLLKKYPDLLDLYCSSLNDNLESVRAVFDRDLVQKKPSFRKKAIHPTTDTEGKERVDDLFHHLTTKGERDKSEGRYFDGDRTVRMHWVRHHLEEKKKDDMLIFSTCERRNTYRTYIYDKDEKYVIVLEPLRNRGSYYLLTAYKLQGKDKKRNKIEQKYKNDRLDEVI